MSSVDTQTYRRQSLSLNDLDHILNKHDIIRLGKQVDIPRLDLNTYSSSELSFNSDWIPAAPLQPAYPPPARIMTPPGLPPFGSRQATLLRLPQRRSSRASLRLRSWLHSHDDSNEHAIASASASSMASPRLSPVQSPSLLPSNPPNEPADSRDLLRRTLAAIGMSRVLDPDPADRATLSPPTTSPLAPKSSASLRSNIPSWVYWAETPGPLARAEDGTYVRGTFGPRGSGHGIGARTIDALPLSRLAKRMPGPVVPALPRTLAELRRTDAVSGRRSVSAIGPAEQDRRIRARSCVSQHQQEEEQETGRDCCDAFCQRFCQYCCGVPVA